MRDPFVEYRKGLLSWDEAYCLANNMAATTSDSITTESSEVDYWASQMESLAVDLAENLMKTLGYKQNDAGAYFKPGTEVE